MRASQDPIWIHNLPKLIVACLTIAVVGLLIGLGRIESVAGLPIISATGVYILTNGVRAERRSKDSDDA